MRGNKHSCWQVHDWNFKNGAFKDSITSKTTTFDGIDVMRASALLTENEKFDLMQLRQNLQAIASGQPSMSSMTVLVETFTLGEKVTKMFDEDRKKQGQYVPPMMMYAMGKDNKVKESFALSDDGTKTFEGGEVGVVPGAPEEFNQAQREHWAGMGFAKNAGKDQPTKYGAKAGASKSSKPGAKVDIEKQPLKEQEGKSILVESFTTHGLTSKQTNLMRRSTMVV